MAFTTITSQETVGLGVTGLPDTPGLSTESMQAEFDEYPIFIKNKFVTHIEEEEAETAAADIGATIPASLTNVTTKKIQPILDELASRATGHIAESDNPHSVTKEQVGLGNVPNVTTDDQTPTITEASSLSTFAEGDTLKDIVGKTNKAIDSLGYHIHNYDNPHQVTKSQIGLGNCDNTADLDKPISTATQTALNGKAPTDHAATATTYGGGTASNYGHVKVSDSYTSSDGAAADSVAASSKALSDAYSTLNSGKAPEDHASTANTYGVGTGTKYGHLKIADGYTSSAGAASDGMAASSKAVSDSYSALNTAKADKDHASTTTDFGISTSTKYGHAMLTDAYNPTTATDADDGVAVSQKGVKDAYQDLLGRIGAAGGGDMMKTTYDPDEDGVIAPAQGGTGTTSNTANSVLVGNGTSAIKNIASASGALYATASNGEPQFGTLPVAQGGTGKTSITSGKVLVGNGTSAPTETGIDTTVTDSSNNLITSGAVYTAIDNSGHGDMLKSTYDPDEDGVIGVAQGGTGQTTLAEARNAMGLGNSTSQLAVGNGGTGNTSNTSNSVLVGNGTSALKNIASAKGAFHSTGSGVEPSFGTLPVDEGGTGLTASPSMLVNLASSSAANVLAASPRPGVTGVLPVANGGTGASSTAGLLDGLGVTPKSDIAPDYSGTIAYTAGTYVYYTNGGTTKLYKCKQNTSAGTAPTNTAYWEEASISDGLTDLNNELNAQHRRKRKSISANDLRACITNDGVDLSIKDITIGDYITINSNYKAVVADIDTFYGEYDYYAVVNSHHIAMLIVGTAVTVTQKWNSSDTTSSGYNGSALHTALKNLISTIEGTLGTLISHQKLLTTATSNWAWQASQKISALTESQIYGAPIWSIDGYQQGEAWKQLEIFRKFSFNEIFGNQSVWLRSVRSASYACLASSNGIANYYSASTALGVVGLVLFH